MSEIALPQFWNSAATDRQDWYRSCTLAYLRHTTISLCLRELNRLIAMEMLEARNPQMRSPVLDVGCGDAYWWTLRANHSRKVYGIDISSTEIIQAKRRITADIVDISKQLPFPGIEFQQIIGNCSLEHVRDIDSALKNLRESAGDGAHLVLFVPAPHWAYHGVIQSWLLQHFPRLAMLFSGALNGFFQHWHLYDVPVWQALLEKRGWKVKEVHGLGNSRSEFLFRLFLPSSFFGFLAKSVFGVYPNRLLRWVPDFVLAPVEKLVRWALTTPLVAADHPKTYEYLLVAEADPNVR